MELIDRVYILVFDLLQVSILINTFWELEISIRKIRLMVFVAISAMLFAVSHYVENIILYNNTNLILCMLFFMAMQKNPKKKRFLTVFLVYVAISAVDALAGCAISNIFILEESNIVLCSSILGTVVIFIFAKIYRRCCNRKLVSENKRIMILSYSIVLLGILTAMFPIFIADENLKNSTFSMIFSLMSFSVILGSIVLIHFTKVNDEYRLQEKINQEKEKLLNDYYSDVLKNSMEVRKFQHDYKNYIRSIRYFAREEKYDEMLAYIQELDNMALFSFENVVDVGNEFVSAILNDYTERSKQMNIVISVSGVIPEQSQIKDIDWSIILSNCMNNALEATLRVEDYQRKINVKFSSLVNKLFIEIRNPFDERPVICDGEMRTIKSDILSHGFGIKNIKSSVSKYKGDLSYEIVNDKIMLTKIVMMY